MEKLIGKEYAIATLKNFRTCLKHLKSFLWKTYKKSDINLIKLEPSFLNDFDFYLRTEAQVNNNAAVKHSKNLAKILKLCYRNGWIEKDLVQYYNGKYLELFDVTDEQSDPVLLLLDVILFNEGGLYGESRLIDAGGELVDDPVAVGLFDFLGRFLFAAF